MKASCRRLRTGLISGQLFRISSCVRYVEQMGLRRSLMRRSRHGVVSLVGIAALTGALLPSSLSVPASAAVTFTSTAVAQHSNLCVDVPGDSTANGTQLVQAVCDQGASQRLTFTPVAGQGETYTISPAHTGGNCVDVSGT